jgi:hypothetical protein
LNIGLIAVMGYGAAHNSCGRLCLTWRRCDGTTCAQVFNH